MILDIDIGNTRVKWLHRDSVRVLSHGALLHQDLDTLPETRPERVRLVSVNDDMSRSISELTGSRWGLPVERASVSDGVNGVVCGYDDASKLGVDRWLAVLAARERYAGDLLVVDAGSALTLDIVTSGGVHLGGYIVPGLALMMKTLWEGTWGVKTSGHEGRSLEPGRDTQTAVSNGGSAALVGMIELMARRFSVDNIVITGGDGPALEALIDIPVTTVYEPLLVLEGLEIALP